MNPLIHIRIAFGRWEILELAFLYRLPPDAEPETEPEEEPQPEPEPFFQTGFCSTADIAPPAPDPVFRGGEPDCPEEVRC